MKKCSKCGEPKPTDAFRPGHNQCKDCVSAYNKAHRIKNWENISSRRKLYYEQNRDKIREYNKQHNERRRGSRAEYKERNRDKIKKQGKLYYEKNRDKIKEYGKLYQELNREKVSARTKKHQQDNREKINQHCLDRYHTDIHYRLMCCLRARVRMAMKQGVKLCSTTDALGCSAQELRVWLESKFTDGMTWDNYGQWHIDHEVPVAWFDLTNAEQFKTACHFTNLQPLWARDNFVKGATI